MIDFPSPPAWQSRARCAGISNPDVFFPPKGQRTTAALRLCSLCPVTQDCLGYAIEHQIEHGVWGGMSTPQRRHYAYQQARQAEQQQVVVFDHSKRLDKMLRLIRLRYILR